MKNYIRKSKSGSYQAHYRKSKKWKVQGFLTKLQAIQFLSKVR